MIEFQEIDTYERIKEIEKLERKYYKSKALSMDILSPIANIMGFIIAATESDKIVGYTAFSRTRKPEGMHCVALTVKTDYRRQGIGSTLLTKAEDICRKRDIEFITGTASPDNIASCKTFLNSANWNLTNIYKSLYSKGKYSCFFVKKFEPNKRNALDDIRFISLSNPEEIMECTNKGYYGKKIFDDSLIEMQGYNSRNLGGEILDNVSNERQNRMCIL